MIKRWSLKTLRAVWQDDYYRKLISLGMIVFFYMLFGSVFYGIVERWSFTDAFYFVGMTITTVGYGDLVPTHTISKLVTIFYSLAGIGIVFYVIGVIGKHYVEMEEERISRLMDERLGLTKNKLKKK